MSKSNNKSSFVFIIVIFLIVIAFLVFFYFRGSNNSLDFSDNTLIQNNTFANAEKLSTTNNQLNELNNRINNIMSEPSEVELATYTTNLGNSSEGRLTNIQITCRKLDGIIINPGETFSFNDSTGPSLAEEGYQNAPVIVDGETVQDLGGGNCQVSSTLYNAVLAVSGLEVTERHEHGKDVSYVPDGKDAAVSYGGYDFSFKNNTENRLKLYFSSNDETISVKISKVSE